MKISRKIRDSAFYALSLIVVFSCSSLTKQTSPLNSFDILKELLRETLSYEITNEQAHLFYCPDNTCLVFSGERQYLNQLSDFSLLYLYHISTYVYLARDMHGSGIFVDKARLTAEQLENHYGISCPVGFNKRVSCIMQKFIKYNDFNVRSVRLDEGEKIFMSVDLQKKISEEYILKIKQSR